MFVGSFGGDFVQFETDTVNAFNAFKTAGITNLLIDLTNNGGTAKHFTSLIDNIFSNLCSYITFRGLCLPWPVPPPVPCWSVVHSSHCMPLSDVSVKDLALGTR